MEKEEKALTRDELITKYYYLAGQGARRFIKMMPRGSMDVEDLQGILAEQLIGAAEAWDHTKGASFTYFAMNRFRSVALNESKYFYAQRRIPPEKMVSLDQPYETSEGLVDLHEFVPDPQDNVEDKLCNAEAMAHAMSTITHPLDLYILNQVLNDKRILDISRDMGKINPSYEYRRAIALRRKLEKAYQRESSVVRRRDVHGV